MQRLDAHDKVLHWQKTVYQRVSGGTTHHNTHNTHTHTNTAEKAKRKAEHQAKRDAYAQSMLPFR